MRILTTITWTLALLIFPLSGVQANLLTNGDFELPGDGSTATGWEAWAWGGGWSNTEQAGWGSGSWHLAAGGAGNAGGGAFQIVPATAGLEYELSVSSGADAWWLPTGRMEMFFLDATSNTISSVTDTTVDPADYGMNTDIPHPWEPYSVSGTAPALTALIKVEFSGNETSWPDTGGATGSVGFDDASLVVIPEPATLAILGLGSTLLLVIRRKRT